ncbi:MAG: GGDEF domain-containing protein [Campylobacterales bacterium]|nr:GGDEF domain-containing protein [Campylobacterales bacterium]
MKPTPSLKQPFLFSMFGCLATFALIAFFANYARSLHQERALWSLLQHAQLIEKNVAVFSPFFPLHVSNHSVPSSEDSFLTLGHYQHREVFEYTLFVDIKDALPTSTLSLFHPEKNHALLYHSQKPAITVYYPLFQGTQYLTITLKDTTFFSTQETLFTYGVYGAGISLLCWLSFFFYVAKMQLQHAYSHAIEQTLNDTKTLALTDPLTGISNRVKGDDALTELIDRSNRFGQPFSLISFDIDHFKNINDTLGHPAGDTLLINLCIFVKTFTKSSDIFVRWGGEEFLLLLPGAAITQATVFATKLCEHIPDQRFLPTTSITCSFGVVEHYHNESQKAILARLDGLLYEAKTTGRNRVVREMTYQKNPYM